MQNIEDAARAACATIGIEFKPVPLDDNWHTANLINDPRGKNDGRIKLFPDGQGGIVWNHKTGEKQTFFINRSSEKQPPDPEAERRIEAARTEREKQRLIAQREAADKAAYIWKNNYWATSSIFYLHRKGIQPHGTKQGKNYCLIIPVFDAENKLVNLQFISSNGEKRFLKGGRKRGCFWWIGDIKIAPETILIAEGFGTAASLHEATGHLVFIAFDAGNLEPVARIIRSRYQNAKIVVCADNDASGTGQRYANQSAAAIDGLVAMPPETGMDFNDWACGLKQGGGHDR